MRVLKILTAICLLGLAGALSADPNAPGSVQAHARNFGGFVDVSWDSSAYNGVDIGAYFLEVDTGSGFQQREVVDGDDGAGAFSLACGQSASVRVRAQDADGIFGPYSTPVSASIPCAPSIVNAVVSGGSLTLGWLTPTAQPEALTHAYVAAANVTGLSDAQYNTLLPSSPTTGSSQLSPTNYETWRYRVYEVDDLGAISAPSAEIVVLPQPVISAVRPKAGAVYLRWQSVSSATAPNVSTYALYYDTAAITTSSPVTVVAEPGAGNYAALTLTGLMDGADYYFAVAARGGSLEGKFNALTYTVRASYPNPAITSFKQPQGGPVSLAWNTADLSGATLQGYTVYHSPSPSLAPRIVALTTSAGVTSGLTSLTGTPGVPDYYYVVATDSLGASSSVTPTQNVLNVLNLNSPSLQTPVTGNARVLLNWPTVGADQYQIYRASSNSPAFLDLSTSALSDGLTTGLNYTDSNPVNGQMNYYMAVARQILPLTGSYAESSPSASVAAQPLVLPGMPGFNGSTMTSSVNYYLTATASLSNQTSQSSVVLSWAKAPAGSLVVSSYQAYQGAVGSDAQIGTFVANTWTAFPMVMTATALDAGSSYTFSVEASDASGNTGPRVIRTLSLIPPGAPTITNAYSMSPTAGKATLTWSAPASPSNPLTGYTIYASSNPNTFGSTPLASGLTGASFVDSEPNTVYVQYYRIFANDNLGLMSSNYAAVGVTLRAAPSVSGTPTVPAQVTAMTLVGSSSSGGNVLVQWNPNPVGENVSSYLVYRGPTYVGSTSQLQFTDSNVAYGTSATYQVQAQNSSGFGVSGTASSLTVQPPPPTGLRVIVDPAGGTTFARTLSWDSFGSAVDAYSLYRSTGSFISVTDPTTTSITLTTSTSFTDTTVAPNNSYEYRIASNATGVTGSVTATGQFVTISAGATTPAAPTGFAALALTTGGALSLTWTSGTGNIKFWVFRDSSPLGSTPASSLKIGELMAGPAPAANTFVDVSAQAGTFYYYAVAALDYNGRGTAADVAPAPVSAVAGTPSGLTAVATVSGGNPAVNLNWTLPASTYAQSTYDVFRNGVNLTTVPFGNTTYTDPSVTPNTPLFYKVQPTGNGSYAGITVTAYGKPSVVTGLTATASAGAVNLVWSSAPASDGVTGYLVNYADQNTLPGTVSVTVGVNTSFVVTGVSPTTGVTATVQAINSWGLSDLPVAVSATSNLAAGAMVPLSFTVNAGFEEVSPTVSHLDLNWVKAGTANAFELYRQGTPFAVTQAAGGSVSAVWQKEYSGSVTTTSDLSVTAGSTYYYALTAVSPTGLPGGESYPVFFGPVTPFNYPSLISFTVAVAGDSRVDLAWGLPNDHGTYNLASTPYKVYRGGVLLTATASTSFSDFNVSNGSSYIYSVSVIDGQGHEQPNPSTVTLYPSGPAKPPLQMRFIPGNNQVTVEWLAQSIDNSKYNVYRRDSGALTSTALPLLREVGPSAYNSGTQVVETLVDTTAIDLNTYCYSMAAVNVAGEGPKSDEFCVTPFAPLDPSASPLVTLLVVNRKDVQLGWNACPAGLTYTSYSLGSYRIDRSQDGGSTFTALAAGLTNTAYRDNSTQFGYTYVYRVVPVDSAGHDGISYRVAIISIPAPIDNVLIFKNSFNPAKGETVPIQYVLLNPGHAWVKIYTLQGEYVATLFEEDVPEGTSADHPYLSDKRTWDGHNSGGQIVASGVYLVHLESGGFKSNGRVAVIK